MLKIPLLLVIIDRGPMEKIPRLAAEHEIPLLEMVHGGGSIQDSGEPVTDFREIESLDEEYERLVHAFGEDEKSGMPIVERIYGRASEFVSSIEARFAGNESGEAPIPRKRRAA